MTRDSRESPAAIRARAARVEAQYPQAAKMLREHAALVERVRAPMEPITAAARRAGNRHQPQGTAAR